MKAYKNLKSALNFTSYFLLLIWFIEAINFVLDHSLNQYGILPRDSSSLWHIFVAPFLHGYPLHALSNSLPLFILLILADFHGRKNLIISLIIIITFSGIMTWFMARTGYHLGASSLIFGLWAYLFGMGIIKHDFKSLALATLTFFFYGGMAYQLLYLKVEISWEGHIFGVLAGFLAAMVMARSF
ncbi:MAG: rhomboid family intramembrane serine protease [Gammaproteobacteria bacterium]|nr:rhomboid family intramembrane serine protease [Gammaproteobacteria bacterium]